MPSTRRKARVRMSKAPPRTEPTVGDAMTLTTAAKISAAYMLAVILCGMASGAFSTTKNDSIVATSQN